MYTRHYLVPGCGVQRLFYSLSDRRSYERCEGATKTVVSWACELLYSQIWCFGISAVQSCRKYRNRLSTLISIAFITAWQSFIKKGACQG